MQTELIPNLTPSYLATLVQLNLEFLEQLPPVQVKNPRVADPGKARSYTSRTIPTVKAPTRGKHIEIPDWLTGDRLIDFLESLRPRIKHIATSLAGRCYSPIDPQELEQVGMIAAWQRTQSYDPDKTGSFHACCIIRAHYAMIDFLRREFKVPTISLEEYLTGDDGKALQRELSLQAVWS